VGFYYTRMRRPKTWCDPLRQIPNPTQKR